jgi:hypothetical protein
LPSMDLKIMTQTDVLSLDILSLRTFGPYWHFVPKDVLSHGCYVSRRLVHRMFCPSERFVPQDVLSTFCPSKFCLRMLCLQSVHREHMDEMDQFASAPATHQQLKYVHVHPCKYKGAIARCKTMYIYA